MSSLSSKKRTKTSRQVVKLNFFVCFLEEMLAWKNYFEFVWPLVQLFWKTHHCFDEKIGKLQCQIELRNCLVHRIRTHDVEISNSLRPKSTPQTTQNIIYLKYLNIYYTKIFCTYLPLLLLHRRSFHLGDIHIWLFNLTLLKEPLKNRFKSIDNNQNN